MSRMREKDVLCREEIAVSDCECPQDTARTPNQWRNEKSINGGNHIISSDKFRENRSLSPAVKVTSAEGIKNWVRKDAPGRRKEKSIRGSLSNISSSPTTQKSILHCLSKSKLLVPPCHCCECENHQKKSQVSPLSSPAPPGAQNSRPEKLCYLLKTKEARKIIGCTCTEGNSPKNCSVDCCCPESPGELPPATPDSRRTTEINISTCKSEICSCDECSENYPSTTIHLQNFQSEVPPPSNWRKCGEYLHELSAELKAIRREIEAVKRPNASFNEKILRKYPNKDFSVEIPRLDKKNYDNHSRNTKNTSLFMKETMKTVDRSCQATNSTRTFSKSRGKKVFYTPCACQNDFHSIAEQKKRESGKSLSPRGQRTDFKQKLSYFDDTFQRQTQNSLKNPSTSYFPCENQYCNATIDKNKSFVAYKKQYSTFPEGNETFYDKNVKKNENVGRKTVNSNFSGECEECCVRKLKIDQKMKKPYFCNKKYYDLKIDKKSKNHNFSCENPTCYENHYSNVNEKTEISHFSDEIANFCELNQKNDKKNHNKSSFCCNETNCNVKDEEYSSEHFENMSDHRKSRRKWRKSRQKKRGRKRHDFSLPRIVHTSKSRKNDDKMLVYPPEDQAGSPVSLYKSESFVNFCLEEVDDVGYQYDVTYIQKYRSCPWRPGEAAEDNTNSSNFSSDDYG